MTISGKPQQTGIWILGALGDIASTLTIGTLAIRKGLTSHTGLVSELSPMSELDLPPLDSLVIGGQDIRPQTLTMAVEEVYRRSRTFSHEILEAVREELATIERDIVHDEAFSWNAQEPRLEANSLQELIIRQREMLRAFKTKHSLQHIVVVNLTSAEPQVADSNGFHSLDKFDRLIAENRKDLIPPSMVYAYAAFMEGCSHINFTPNPAASIPALQELAEQQGVPHYGNDGKTGETLIKTALAPLFAHRHLRIMSWEGFNMLGNGDGKTLDNPVNKAAKLQNKAQVLDEMLGYPVHSDVAINYVPSLGDWKMAWDLIHFQGFLDVPMSMQFTWQGCDSILAAPLVLDMVRFSEFAARHGEAGTMYHLASYFKNPMGVKEMAFFPQFERLLTYTQQHLAAQDDKESTLRITG